MRKIVAISALSVLATGLGVAGVMLFRSPTEPMTADLERDLNLASSVRSQRTGVVSAIEQVGGGPSANKPAMRQLVVTQKRAPSAARSKVVAEVAIAPVVSNNPEPAPSPVVSAPTEVAVAAPAPAPVQAPAPDVTTAIPTSAPAGGPSAESERGASDVGRGTGTGDMEGTNRGGRTMGGIIGVVVGAATSGAIMRGGNAGDDNCKPTPRQQPLPGSVIGAVGGILASGRGAPMGSIPNGPASPGRRW